MTFYILLQLAQAAGEGDKSPFSTLLLIPIMLVIMYFLVIRPQRNEEKKRKEMIDSLKKGDEVITSSGIHGKVVEIKDNNEVVVLNIAKDTNVSFTASTVLKKKQQADK
ncbi:preprotein translocase subunit YajC [Leptospira kirschneri]|uniref:Sec translocon accessory complex subunit YajC n=4 Tax=Leptospira kirschneri TaxID=29507 RepID=A0A1T1DS88_9LEPT|nr:preprotein translocase subunit YajC [Leptospira kirschneri]EMO77827.1 preprotein translocase, YajC subunit [Leptospira kirschneri str. 200801925]EJO71449.1 preprotein translocase, YajC subunit [Leptospira kirschneri serovar Grippotyphosa str. RM52]EKO15655.1 preprotein translocase, YajC subunit [Leptospira kirschneri str. H1]EKO51701.1 preprotein translocase, YajC subunit [Leptospira kirschneri str. 200802841]EKO59633.1 preprotein translocase, YajC subunit [Leptospira kirschneri str. H2]